MKLAASIALLVLVTLATYWRVLSNDFISIDDPVMVAKNPALNPPTAAGVAKYWVASARALYMPLTYTAWAAAAALPHDGDILPARRFHALSLAVHVLTVLAVFALLRELVANNFAAAAGALLFALHPLQVETVAWVSLLKDLLAGMFSVTAVWLYVRFVKCSADPQASTKARTYYALAMLAFLLGMFSKPSAVIAPLIAAAIDVGLLRRQLQDAAKSLWPWLVLALPFVLVAQNAQHGNFQPLLGAPRDLPLWWRPIVAGDAVAFYLHKLVWTPALAIDYGRSPWQVMSHAWIWLTAAVPVVLAIDLWLGRAKVPGLSVAFIVMTAALLPVLGFVPFDFQEKSTVSDHYMYLPMLGPAMALAWCLWRWPRRINYIITLLALILAAFNSRMHTLHWRDSVNAYRWSLAVNPQSWWLSDGLGWHMLEAGKPADAIEHFRRAIDLAPNYAAAHAHLGAAYAETANVTGAVTHLERSLAIDPYQPRTHVLLGDIQLLRGLPHEAARHYQAAGKQAPDDPVVAERLNRLRRME